MASLLMLIAMKKEDSTMDKMKTALALALVAAFIAVPAYATLETAGSALALPEKTLKDFRSDYGGTKPLVACMSSDFFGHGIRI